MQPTVIPAGGFRDLLAAVALSISAGCSSHEEQPIASEPGESGTASDRTSSEPSAGGIIAGRVVGPDHQGVAGIEIEAVSWEDSVVSRAVATSTKDGEFLIEGLPRGAYMVRANSIGFRSAPADWVELGETNLLLTLLGTGTVRGRVIDPTGHSLGDFRCKVRTVNEVSYAFGAVVAQQAFQGATDGEFELPGVPEGGYVIEGVSAGYASCFSEPFDVCQGQVTNDVVVHMTFGGSLEGLVVDVYSGSAIAGVEVKTADSMLIGGPLIFGALEPSALTKTTVETDGNGRFEIAVLTPGDYQVQWRAQGYTAIYLNDVHVVEGQRTELTVQKLHHGALIRGVVHGRDGGVAPGATVMLTPVDKNLMWSNRKARADASGAYVIENAQAGTYKLSASRPDNKAASPFDEVVDMRQSEIEIRVKDGGQYEYDLHMGPVTGR